MTSTIVATKKFTVDLTKAELDSIHKQFLDELEEMLNKVRTTTTTREECGKEEKSYCNTIVRDNVTVTLTLKNKNKINKINNNLINNNNNNNNNNNKENTVNVTVTLSCVLLLHYLFSTF
jgi:hypothetical protein